ncbi:GATA transcription factor 12 [Bienertia sinuspersici]
MSAMKTRPDQGSETRPEASAHGLPRVIGASRLIVLAPEAREHVLAAKPTKPAGQKKKEYGPNWVRPIVDSPPGGEVRKCLHCGTDKTPQWRTGPMGPKTLCNACGVRYKSGRLVPEYRPAASPTFMLTKHSNSHRKVMELRRQKELMRQQQMPTTTTTIPASTHSP